MATSGDDIVFRLLCHLAWLTGQAEKEDARTLHWAYRVYNTSVQLQWRYVYPHETLHSVMPADDLSLALSIEGVVSSASEALNVLRTDSYLQVKSDDPLPPTTGNEIVSAVDALLDDVCQTKWREGVVAKQQPSCDEAPNPLRNLQRWKSSRRIKPPTNSAMDDTDPATTTQTELNKGLGTEIVIHSSRAVESRTPAVKDELRKMSKTMREIDVEQCANVNAAYGSRIPADILDNMARSLSGRSR